MPIFDNPNFPVQPIGGVYVWYFCLRGVRFVLYVGRASGPRKATSPKRASTLFRGVAELSQNHSLLSNTNVRIGATIAYIESRYSTVCHWRHISSNPKNEARAAHHLKPLIQYKTRLRKGDLRRHVDQCLQKSNAVPPAG